jgi:hypothetical protein
MPLCRFFNFFAEPGRDSGHTIQCTLRDPDLARWHSMMTTVPAAVIVIAALRL